MSYIIAPLQKVRSGQYPEYYSILKALETAAITRAAAVWGGFSPGGMIPGNQQFGHSNPLPKRILGAGTFTWLQRFTAPGSFVNIISYTVPTDEIHAYAGFAVADALAFSQVQALLSDRTFPIIEIEEARTFENGVAIILKQDRGQEWIVEEKKNFTLRGYQERGSNGIIQRIIPLGFALFRNKDIYISTGRT